MAWKCNTCGMPNFDDDACKLCGAPKPENPEEFIEETETPAIETESQEPIAASVEETEPTVVPEEPIQEPEIADAPVEEPVQEAEPIDETVEESVEESAEEPEPVEAPIEEPAQESETVEPPAEEPTEEPEPVAAPVEKTVAPVTKTAPKNKKSKKGAVITVICVIMLALLGAAAAYMYVKNDAGKATAGETISSVSPSPEATPSIEPEAESEVSIVPSADPLDEIIDEEIPDKTVTTPAKPSSTPSQKTEGKTPAKVTTKPAAKPTAVATPKPAAVSKPAAEENWNDAYKKYVSKEFGFYCAYPKDFSVVETGNANDALLTLTSPDKTANMIIQGLKNWEKLSVEEALERYIGLFDGKVYYRDHGNTWYAASVVVGDRVYYRKAFVRGGNIYCFSFEYDKKDQALYRPYIEYIEDHFKRN